MEPIRTVAGTQRISQQMLNGMLPTAGVTTINLAELPAGTQTINIPRVQPSNYAGEMVPPLFLANEYARTLDHQLLIGATPARRRCQTPRRTPSYRERQRRARAARAA
jgi:hypothetical protein